MSSDRHSSSNVTHHNQENTYNHSCYQVIHGEEPPHQPTCQEFCRSTVYRSNNIKREEQQLCTNLGIATTFNNWLVDSGATAHMTPCLNDLSNQHNDEDLAVTVADGHVVPCSITGTVTINQFDDHGKPFTMQLRRVLYVPGLRQRLISTTALTDSEHGVFFTPQHLTPLILGLWRRVENWVTKQLLHNKTQETKNVTSIYDFVTPPNNTPCTVPPKNLIRE
ncbi:MAG: hypothetical protein ACREOZ_03235 [Gloeomargaritales cyanobacterium]